MWTKHQPRLEEPAGHEGYEAPEPFSQGVGRGAQLGAGWLCAWTGPIALLPLQAEIFGFIHQLSVCFPAAALATATASFSRLFVLRRASLRTRAGVSPAQLSKALHMPNVQVAWCQTSKWPGGISPRMAQKPKEHVATRTLQSLFPFLNLTCYCANPLPKPASTSPNKRVP